MVRWTVALETSRQAYEAAARALGVEPVTRTVEDGLIEVSADLPAHYQSALRDLVKAGVAPEAITHESVANRLSEAENSPPARGRFR